MTHLFHIWDHPQQYIFQRPGIDPIAHFSLSSGPLEKKFLPTVQLQTYFTFGISTNSMFYKGLGSIQLVIFFTSGPVDKKFHTNSPMTNLFHIWDQSQQDIFINAWDQSHS